MNTHSVLDQKNHISDDGSSSLSFYDDVQEYGVYIP